MIILQLPQCRSGKIISRLGLQFENLEANLGPNRRQNQIATIIKLQPPKSVLLALRADNVMGRSGLLKDA